MITYESEIDLLTSRRAGKLAFSYIIYEPLRQKSRKLFFTVMILIFCPIVETSKHEFGPNLHSILMFIGRAWLYFLFLQACD